MSVAQPNITLGSSEHPAIANREVACVAGIACAALIAVGPTGSVWMLCTVGALVAVCALVDFRRGIIPNVLVLSGLCVVVAFASVMVIADDVPAGGLAAAAMLGVVMSGAAGMFVVWLVRPAWIGGGDWKLLALIGVALGMIDPRAAAIAGIGGTGLQLAISAVLRRRRLPCGPAFFLGYTAAAVATARFHAGAGGWA